MTPIAGNVDARGIKQISGDREVEATGRASGLLHHLHTSGQIVVTLLPTDNDMTRDYHHL